MRASMHAAAMVGLLLAAPKMAGQAVRLCMHSALCSHCRCQLSVVFVILFATSRPHWQHCSGELALARVWHSELRGQQSGGV